MAHLLLARSLPPFRAPFSDLRHKRQNRPSLASVKPSNSEMAGGPDLTPPQKVWVAQVSILRPGRQQTSLRANAWRLQRINTLHHPQVAPSENKPLTNQQPDNKKPQFCHRKQPNPAPNQQIQINLNEKSAPKSHTQFRMFFAQKPPKSPFFAQF